MRSRVVRLQDVVDINPTTKCTASDNAEVAFVAMADVSESGQLVRVQRRSLQEVKKGYTAFAVGDVLLAKITPCFENGKAALIEELPTPIGFGSTEFHVLRPSKEIDGRFLFHLVWNPKFRRLGELRMTGSAGQRRVPTAFLSEHAFQLPPIAEQQRIARILDGAESLCRKRRKAICLADEFLRAAFFEKCGDPVSNSMAWPERELSDIGTVTTGNTPSREVAAYYGDAIEWIKSDNINTPSHSLTKAREGLSKLGASAGRIVSEGATLMTCIAGSADCIGNVAMTDRRVAFNQQINAITPAPGVESEFLYALLLFSKLRIQASSTNSMKGMVSKGALEKVKLIWPSESAQKEIAALFRHVQRLVARMEDADPTPLLGTLQNKLFL